MRFLSFASVLLAAGFVAADNCYVNSSNMTVPCHANNCLRAIRRTSSAGFQFCTEAVPYHPVTRTVTLTRPACNTSTITQTITVYNTRSYWTTTTTITSGDVVTTLPPSEPTNLARRANPNPQITEHIRSQCSYDSAKISSACYCFLGGPSPTTSVTSTLSTCTLFTYATAITTHPWQTVMIEMPGTATQVVPTQGINLRNTGFDRDLSIRPWAEWAEQWGGFDPSVNFSVRALPDAPSQPNAAVISFWDINTLGTFEWMIQNMTNLHKQATYYVSFQYKLSKPVPEGIEINAFAGSFDRQPPAPQEIGRTFLRNTEWTTLALGQFIPSMKDGMEFSIQTFFLPGQGDMEVYYDNFEVHLTGWALEREYWYGEQWT